MSALRKVGKRGVEEPSTPAQEDAKVFIGSVLQGRGIVMHSETGQSLVPYILGSCGVHYKTISSSIWEGSTWASPC